MRIIICLLLVTSLSSATVAGQDVMPRTDGLLSVETNSPDAIVLVGSEAIGIASESPFLLPAGPKQITLVEATTSSWAPRRVTGTVIVTANQTTTLRLNLPVRYRIDSMPPGAEISLEFEGRREIIGITPLVTDRPDVMDGILVARSRGYMDTEVEAGDSIVNHHMLMMQPLEAGVELDAVTTWIPPRQPRRWIDYAAAGVALAAAGTAIYYKFEADSVDDRYRSPESPERGDPLLKSEAERLDLYSLAALGAMQVGITVLAVRFVLR